MKVLITRLDGLIRLFSGQIVVQLFPFITMPLVTRLFSPAALGKYQIAATLILIVSPLLLLSLNEAIVKENCTRKAGQLLLGSFYIMISVAIAACLLFYWGLQAWENSGYFSIYEILLMFIILIFSGSFVLVQAVELRGNRYRNYTLNLIRQSAIGNLSKIPLGLYDGGFASLLLSLALGFGVSTALGVKVLWRKLLTLIKEHWRFNIINLVRERKEFTVFGTFSSFVGILGAWLIVLAAPLFAEPSEVGLLSLAIMIVRTPLSPLVSSMASFLYAELATQGQNEPKLKLFLSLAVIGGLISISAVLFLSTFGVEVISIVFGEAWSDAAPFAVMLALPFISGFLFYPIYSACSKLDGKQRRLFMGDLMILVFSLLATFWCAVAAYELSSFVFVLSLIQLISHILKYFLVII